MLKEVIDFLYSTSAERAFPKVFHTGRGYVLQSAQMVHKYIDI